jgi:predicted metal-dependent phosphoesterase TrpH
VRIRSFADLHTHTLFSDGLSSPARLVKEAARQAGLRVFALTDHDSLSGIEPVFRCLAGARPGAPGKGLRFLPGVELSLLEKGRGITVHLLGYFPHMTSSNHREILRAVDSILGPYCRSRCRERGVRDLDERLRIAFQENLEGIRDRYASAGEVLDRLHTKAEQQGRRYFEEAGKKRDIIQHPVPITYQVLLDHWTELLPHSSRERAELFILRKSPERTDRLARLYHSDGLPQGEARQRAERNAGVLAQWSQPPTYAGISEGMDLLKASGAVSVLAHPAVDHGCVDRETFDRSVTMPLIQAGLDGIEVHYPYAASLREEAWRHYGAIAKRHGLLVSGGTDFHGDGRAGLGDVRLPMRCAQEILARGNAAG